MTLVTFPQRRVHWTQFGFDVNLFVLHNVQLVRHCDIACMLTDGAVCLCTVGMSHPP